MKSYIQTLNSFTLDTIPDLDIAVMGALELFQKESPPKIQIDSYKRPLVVGSGNAEATGRIIFQKHDAIFASESSVEEKLESIPTIDGVVLISASGSKHAPIIAELAKKYQKHITLITNTKKSPAGQVLEGCPNSQEFVFPKNREPYTYNTSTYMGMILGHSQESPAEIMKFIQEALVNFDYPDFSKYDKYYLIVPYRFSGIVRMLQVKFIELFGRRVARDVETSEYVRHATTVVPSENELFIAFGEENNTWGKPENRLNIPLPKTSEYGAMMAVGYYVVGQIQKAHPAYFKENIQPYMKMVSEVFGQELKPIVEA